jgi:hypothetical protein
MLIEGLKKLKIVSKFGYRVREGKQEFHEGIDIRVVDAQWHVKNILAPEDIKITEINLSPKWGHWIKAVTVHKNDLGIDELRFWHIVPAVNVGDIIPAGNLLGKPEAGYVDLHLHLETRAKGKLIDPVLYLKQIGQEVELNDEILTIKKNIIAP